MVTIEHAALVVTGIGILLWQNALAQPSDVMVTAALVLIGLPGGHAAAQVLGAYGTRGQGSGSSRESSPDASPGESGSHQGGDGEHSGQAEEVPP